MPQVGFETTIPALESSETVRPSDRTVFGSHNCILKEFHKLEKVDEGMCFVWFRSHIWDLRQLRRQIHITIQHLGVTYSC
jgi:hypothetical protein